MGGMLVTFGTARRGQPAQAAPVPNVTAHPSTASVLFDVAV